MALWRVKRIENAPEGIATVDCVAGEVPTLVTLEDTDTGDVSNVQLCVNPAADFCDILRTLDVTYSPNDWQGDCPTLP